jgi:hypothetical protein
MYRLNVAASQYEACVTRGMFALDDEPHLAPGELLLLQLNKRDWTAAGGQGGRVRNALVFQRAEADPDGSLSRQHWPNAGKVWRWILYASAVVQATPFSLEQLPLERESLYQSQRNLIRVDAPDALRIAPYFQWENTSALIDSVVAPAAFGDDTKDVEDFAVARAVPLVAEWFPGTNVTVMPHNNPGFDLLVCSAGQVSRYIEVKGTRRPDPTFFMTETERRFSAQNSALYTVAMVWNINLGEQTCAALRHDGEVKLDSVLLPMQYRGRFPNH